MDRLRAEETWRTGDRNATTLVKEPGLRVVLTVLKAGGRVREHRADAALAIQVLSGHVIAHLPDGPEDLAPGRLLTLEPGVPHDVEGVQESAFLLTLGGGAS